MKMKILSIFLSITSRINSKNTLVVFALFFLSVSFGEILGQTVSITATQPNANEEGPVDGQFLISLTGGSTFIQYEIFLSVDPSSTATSDDDYEPLPISVPLTGLGTTRSRLVTLSVEDDDFDEIDETVIWRIDNRPGYTPSPTANSASITIQDNDIAGITVS
ncbi:MAG: hypothetical protein WA810_11540, partial [Maribacter sp.]